MEYMVSIPPRNLIIKGEKIIFTNSALEETTMSYEEVKQFPHLLNFVLKFVGDKPINIKTKF